MTPVPPIPADLRVRYEVLRKWMRDDCPEATMPEWCPIPPEMELIERIAKLTAEVERLKKNVEEDMYLLSNEICRRQTAEAEITRLKAPVTDEEQLYEDGRCQICGWPLAESFEKGCVENNCSYRPQDHSPEWYRLQRRREFIRSRAAIKEGQNG